MGCKLAMRRFNPDRGLVVTLNQSETMPVSEGGNRISTISEIGSWGGAMVRMKGAKTGFARLDIIRLTNWDGVYKYHGPIRWR